MNGSRNLADTISHALGDGGEACEVVAVAVTEFLREFSDDPWAVECVSQAINPNARHPQDRAWADQEAAAAIKALADFIAADIDAGKS